jgi:hypothetical protein
MPDAERREAVAEACRSAIAVTGTDHPAVRSAEEYLRRPDPAPPQVLAELDATVRELDDRYFGLLDDDGAAASREAVAHFSRARAASALRFAVSDGSPEAAQEAVYEAATALDDPTALLRSLDLSGVAP